MVGRIEAPRAKWTRTRQWSAATVASALLAFAAFPACSLILSASSLDEDFGKDAGADAPGSGGAASTSSSSGTTSTGTTGSSGTTSSTSTTSGGTTGSAGTGGADAGCACAFGCAEGRCLPRMLSPIHPTAIACAPGWVYAVGSDEGVNFGLTQFPAGADAGSGGCACLTDTDPAVSSPRIAYEVAVSQGKVVWRTYDGNENRFWTLDDAACCGTSARTSQLVPVRFAMTPGHTSDLGWGIATDGTNVFWLGASTVERAPLAMDAGATSLGTENLGALSGLAMPDERIFFTSYGTPTVYQFSPADAGADSGGLKMWQDPGGFYSLRGVRSDGNLLVWAAEDTGPDAGEIHGITLSGVGPPLTATFVDPEGLDLDDGGRVYVSDQGAGTVSRFSYATPSDITTLWESAGSAPKNLCTAGGFVYWISNEGLLQIDATVP